MDGTADSAGPAGRIVLSRGAPDRPQVQAARWARATEGAYRASIPRPRHKIDRPAPGQFQHSDGPPPKTPHPPRDEARGSPADQLAGLRQRVL